MSIFLVTLFLHLLLERSAEIVLMCRAFYSILLLCFVLPKMHRVANEQYLFCNTFYIPFLKRLW